MREALSNVAYAGGHGEFVPPATEPRRAALLFEIAVAGFAMLGLVAAELMLSSTIRGTNFAGDARVYYQSFLAPAINYACTGHFGAIRLSPDASPTDAAGITQMQQFLAFQRADYSCDVFPQHLVPTAFFDGVAPNVVIPLNLTLLYAMVWRIFGVDWVSTDYMAAAIAAVSFLAVYVCARGFMPPFVAAVLTLFFISSPFFIVFSVHPRDAFKFPFAILIAAILTARISVSRTPGRFILFGCGIGVLIGIGYGFRSDIYLFLFPALATIAVLGRVDLCTLALRRTGRLTADAAVRAVAACAVVGGFIAGGAMPLFNDRYYHVDAGELGYHNMAMGLLGNARPDLFQSHGVTDGDYMFRDGHNNDLAVGLRIMEYALRRAGKQLEFAAPGYWHYSKLYYLDVVSLIPADLLSAAIGGFENLMTLPESFRTRQGLQGQYDRSAPWTKAYAFTNDTFAYSILESLDKGYNALASIPTPISLIANLSAFFILICLVSRRFGIRGAIAALTILGSAVAITSLKFEIRHMFYIYAFSVLSWGAAMWLIVRTAVRPFLFRLAEPDQNGFFREFKSVAVSIASVTLVLLLLTGLVLALLFAARSYQVTVMRALMEDWGTRPRLEAKTEIVEVAPGTSRIRISSAVPLSIGGQREPDAPVVPRVEMGVVAVETDGQACGGRGIALTAIGDTNLVPQAYGDEQAFMLYETFSTSPSPNDYVVYFPIFYFRFGSVEMRFAGIQVQTSDVPCIKGIKLVTEFKKGDVLFDFVIPSNVARVDELDLFERVLIPGLGYL